MMFAWRWCAKSHAHSQNFCSKDCHWTTDFWSTMYGACCCRNGCRALTVDSRGAGISTLTPIGKTLHAPVALALSIALALPTKPPCLLIPCVLTNAHVTLVRSSIVFLLWP